MRRFGKRCSGLLVIGIVGVVGVRISVAPAAQAAAPLPAPIPVIAATVERQDVPVILEGLGTVQGLNTATIRAQVQGTLESVDFVEGQVVKRGQVLAQIDPRPFQAQLDQAAATLARDQATLSNTAADLRRYQPLYRRGFASGEQVDTQAANVASQQAALKGDAAAVSAARTQLSYATLVAPFDGVTGLRLIDPGNIVHPADPSGVVVITQVQPIAVVFPIPSADIPEVLRATARGAVKAIAFAADDRTQLDQGTLLLIDNEADPQSGTVRLKAIFPNASRTLWPGTFVNVHLVTQVRQNGLLVPLTAVQQGPRGQFVYVVQPDGSAKITPVTTGQSRGGRILIDQGLAAGQTVVVDGQYRLTDGARVAVVSGRQADSVQSGSTASAGMLP